MSDRTLDSRGFDLDAEVEYLWRKREIPELRDELRKLTREERERRAKRQKKLARAARLEQLKLTPAWDELVEVLAEQEEKFWRQHRAAIRKGQALDQRELDRAMGKLDGIRALLSAPERAASIMAAHRKQEEPVED